MNKYPLLAKVIIDGILNKLSIEKGKDNAYYYAYDLRNMLENGDYMIKHTIPICKSEKRIFRLLNIDRNRIFNVSSTIELVDLLEKSPFSGKEFIKVSETMARTDKSLKDDMRNFFKESLHRGMFSKNRPVDNQLLYVKSIDFHCGSKVEDQLRHKANAVTKNKLLKEKLSIVDASEQSNIPMKELQKILTLRSKFETFISKDFKEFKYPFTQYLSCMYKGEVLRDFKDFAKSRDVVSSIFTT